MTRKLVVAALAVREGRALACRRRADQPHALLWELPGGKIEPGETPEAALARELAEELGVSAEIGPRCELLRHRYPEFEVELSVFLCRLRGEPVPRQVAELRWLGAAELPALDWLPADRPLVERWARDGLPAWR